MDEVEKYISEEQLTTLFLTFSLMTIQNLFTLIPLILLVTINLFIYEFTLGFFWSWGTSVAGSIISFVLYRYWLQSLFRKRMDLEMKEKIESHGFLFILYLRLIPFVPSSLVNIAAGASTISFSRYVSATLIGNFIYIFMMCFFVHEMISANIEILPILSGLLGLLLIAYLIRKRKTSKEKEKDMEIK
ncbi:VTT domain-containing protein [Bacillus sp. FJAT-50079]|uniref:TVP38/TMEM64 family protein n=1 Tax=Bacillus sp. FJAT-50079 TaxID=2833577 RepID=UPI001BCA4F82|nr:VTT domain-containing protein [Bacillus sp. FJAT-50079]MBS4206969.1 TVP38/TMEM64 family protein [Bacillus sp. FJAT-50079]